MSIEELPLLTPDASLTAPVITSREVLGTVKKDAGYVHVTAPLVEEVKEKVQI